MPETTLTFQDFTAGLWEPGPDLAVPPNTLRQADDCIPLGIQKLRGTNS